MLLCALRGLISMYLCLSLCRQIWQQTKATYNDKFGDVHTRLMKKNYDPVPQWWFYVLLIVVVGLAILTCEGFGGQLQLPYWGVLLAVAMAQLFTLPIGVITATTNQVWYLAYNFLSSCSLCLIIIVKSACRNQDLMSSLR